MTDKYLSSNDVYMHAFDNSGNLSGLQPVGRAILVELYKVQTHSAGGIEMPGNIVESAQQSEQRARLVACGPLAWRSEPVPRAKIGDHLIFAKYSGYVATGPADGNVYRIVNDTDVFCIMTTLPEEAKFFQDSRE